MKILNIITALYAVSLAICFIMSLYAATVDKPTKHTGCQLSDPLSVLDGVCPAGYRPPLGNTNKNWRCPGCQNKPGAN